TEARCKGRALLGWAELYLGQIDAARRDLTRARDLATTTGEQWLAMFAGFGIALVTQAEGNLETAHDLLTNVLRAAQTARDPVAIASTIGQLGLLAWSRGDAHAAYELTRNGFVEFSRVRNSWGAGLTLAGLARCAGLHGDWRTAVRLAAAADA